MSHVALSALRKSCETQAAGGMGLLSRQASRSQCEGPGSFSFSHYVSFMALSLQSYNEECVSVPAKCLQSVNGSC